MVQKADYEGSVLGGKQPPGGMIATQVGQVIVVHG
jgi:hypothetical protein